MRVFIDVGAHYGETLDVALDPRWGFDRVYSIEPSQACQQLLRKFRDRRIILEDCGLSNRTSSAELYGSGLLGGSVYSDKPQSGDVAAESIALVRASEWLEEHTAADDDVFLKLNCEGGEADILDDLLASPRVMNRLRSIYVDFDIRKIPSQAHRRRPLEDALGGAGVPFVTPESVGKAGNPGVAVWLATASETFPVSPLARMRHAFRMYLPTYLRAKVIVRTLLPMKAYLWVGRRVGRQGRRL